MQLNINGTTIRSSSRGLVLTRGSRELHILGTSVEQTRKANDLAARHSFDRLFKAGKSSPIKNTRVIRLAGIAA